MRLTIQQTVLPIPGGAGVRKMKGVQNPEVQEFRMTSRIKGRQGGQKLLEITRTYAVAP